MKKKFAAILCTFVLLLACLCLPAFAAGKTNVELSTLQVVWGSNRAESPAIYCRNNTSKTIKYLEWYVTAYNRVDDPIPGMATQKLTAVGPTEPFRVIRETSSPLKTNYFMEDDNPFKYYKETKYLMTVNDDVLVPVWQDAYNNFFVQQVDNDASSLTYLTEDEIQNAMFNDWCRFDNSGWHSTVLSYISPDKVVVTYMDGSTETITDMTSKYRWAPLQNPPFVQQLAQYQAVYNYQDYLNCNPDLATQFGANQKALLEHFVTQGMKEGRQGSAEFNLNAYKANNPDLVAMFGDDNVKYYEHFISSGRAEGRVAV